MSDRWREGKTEREGDKKEKERETRTTGEAAKQKGAGDGQRGRLHPGPQRPASSSVAISMVSPGGSNTHEGTVPLAYKHSACEVYAPNGQLDRTGDFFPKAAH